jgi:hypothetical protein
MTQSNDDDKQYLHWQHQRLNYFLIASAFLVAAFIQLVTADRVINNKDIEILVHAVAALGSFIASLYFSMNFLVWLKYRAQVIHTWFIPLCFLAFWLAIWIYIYEKWWAFAIAIVVILGCFLFQRIRGWHSDKLYKQEVISLLSELNDADIRQKVKELVQWEVDLAKEMSQKQEIDPRDTLNAIDKIVGWVKNWLNRSRDKQP